MIEKDKIYSVISGDLVGSSGVPSSKRYELLETLKASFKIIEDSFSDIVIAPFEIYRGDSFQGVISKPEFSLCAAIIIRAFLRYSFKAKKKRPFLDARIAIGIGGIDYLPDETISEGNGEAFHSSGVLLDSMKSGKNRLLIHTPDSEINSEFRVECILLDTIIDKWSAGQAEAIVELLKGKTQEEIGDELGISQPAVNKRLQKAGYWGIEEFCDRLENRVSKL